MIQVLLIRGRSGARRAGALEHLEHPVGDEEAADDVDRPEHDGDERRAPARASSPPCRRSASRRSRTIPWIAFVPDISGVCSIVGTFEITSKPTKIASAKIVSSATSCRAHAGTSSRRVTHAPAVISSSKSSRSSPSGCEVLQQRGHVARVEPRRVGRHRARKVRQADDRDAALDDLLAGLASARSCRRSRPRGRRSPSRAASPRTAAAGISLGAGRPGTRAVVITASNSGIRRSSSSCWRRCSSSVSSRA